MHKRAKKMRMPQSERLSCKFTQHWNANVIRKLANEKKTGRLSEKWGHTELDVNALFKILLIKANLHKQLIYTFIPVTNSSFKLND